MISENVIITRESCLISTRVNCECNNFRYYHYSYTLLVLFVKFAKRILAFSDQQDKEGGCSFYHFSPFV